MLMSAAAPRGQHPPGEDISQAPAGLAHLLREAVNFAAKTGPSEAKAVLPQVAALALVLSLRAGESATDVAPPSPAAESIWLSPAQVEDLYGLAPAWLGQHARDLEQAGLVAKVSRKTRLYHRARLGRWIEARRSNPISP
jgi:hypothetical protein